MNRVTNATALLLPLLFLFCVSCNKPEDKFTPSNEQTDRVSRMSAQERAVTAPNELFQAVLTGDLAAVKTAVGADAALLEKKNEKDQDTALGLAIKLRERAIADYLADQMPLSQYFAQNGAGESYIFLAAKVGYTEIIEMLSQRYYDSFGTLGEVTLWDFVSLDQENNLGQRALHVAADRRTAEVLSTQYWRGSNNIPYWSFTLHVDDLSQTFLHTAAKDGRTDILLWGAEQFCDPTSWERDGGWFGIKYVLGYGGSRVTKWVQTNITDIGAYLALLYNRQDVDYKTPIHVAIESRNIDAVRAVARCRWVDYKLEDQAGNIPLQTSLLQIPAKSRPTSVAERAIFDFVLYKETSINRIWNSRSSYWDHENNDGQTPAHLAARLGDPYFFDTLAKEADVYQKDNQGNTPLEIYEQRQKNLVKLYAH